MNCDLKNKNSSVVAIIPLCTTLESCCNKQARMQRQR